MGGSDGCVRWGVAQKGLQEENSRRNYCCEGMGNQSLKGGRASFSLLSYLQRPSIMPEES